MVKKIALIILLCFVSGSVVFAQSGNQEQTKSGSVYSKIGLGYPVDIGNTAANSMGLLGISYNETYVSSIANPAHWGGTVYGLGYGSMGVQSYNASDGTNSVTNSNFSVNQFQLQFPVIRGKLGISGSFSPVTQSSFRTYEESTRYIGQGANQDTLLYGLENRGSGGTNRAELGVGWQITPNISVGYAASAVFVSLDNSFQGTIANTSYQQVDFALETSGVGMGNRFGTQITISEPFSSSDLIGIGGTVSLPVSIDANRKETAAASSALTVSQGAGLGEGTIKLPMEISGGLSYHPNRLLMIGTEGLYQGWSNYRNSFKPTQNQLFVDRYKWGLGLQYFPYITGSDKFLSNFKYRLGASYDTGHLRIESERINTLKFSFGLGIRSPNTSSSIDISFEYGIRGTNSMDLIKEQIWGVNLSLNLAEVMFYRPRLQ